MRALFALLILGLSGCAAPLAQVRDVTQQPPPLVHEVSPLLAGDDAVDPYSYAQPHVARVSHVALDLALDFDAHRVSGTATLDIIAAAGAHEIVLDSDALEISSVTDGMGRALPFAIGAVRPGMGAPVTVEIGAARRIVLTYRSGGEASALQWLTPDQTAGGRQPYLLSQGQPNLNRSWMPTQDSPGIRQTWEARITAPQPLTVVMSGERLSTRGVAVSDAAGQVDTTRRAFRFRMDHPVAPYLIAIAAGDIAFRSLGPRTGVWTEPVMMEAAAAELTDTERMVDAAEALYGPYRWGRYDMVVLPPSFPYGGMENPTLTFLTPTFIAGDKSLNGLVAHELAHSWSGNLVTNATWQDSWLNEGVTSYFENRIMEQLYGPRRAGQEAALSFDDMEGALAELGATASSTRLHVTGEDANPDGGSSGIVYDKGAIFLRTMERVAGRARFDAYLRSWFDRHAFQPATSALFVADIRAHLVAGNADLERQLMLDQWVYQPGLPANVARPDPAAFADVDTAITAYARSQTIDAAKWAGWTTAERLRYLNRLPRLLTPAQLIQLDTTLHLSHVSHTNNETLFAWLNLALANRYTVAVPVADRFLNSVGRRKFVLPLFRTLWGQGAWGRDVARRIYANSRRGYHPVTSSSVDALMAEPAQ
jgi:aminopeptidase N